jgi:CelD/BcsL family acetyltransferase involved in cellulose biosynthesis
LRDLIRTRVREEVARYNASPQPEFHGLVQPTDAEVRLSGSRVAYHLRVARKLDWEAQVVIAERSFAHNGFFVLVDGQQVVSLDHDLVLTPETEVAFVRLVPLVGG